MPSVHAATPIATPASRASSTPPSLAAVSTQTRSASATPFSGTQRVKLLSQKASSVMLRSCATTLPVEFFCKSDFTTWRDRGLLQGEQGKHHSVDALDEMSLKQD